MRKAYLAGKLTKAEADAIAGQDVLAKRGRLEEMNWPTPTASEGEKVSNCPNYAQTSLGNHPTLVGLPQRPKNSTKSTAGLPAQANPNLNGKQGVLLNAAWVDQLMGFPENWSNVQIEGTD